ncbi:hypothetical protein ACFE04_006989 [Oxalis oulophora]
MEGRAQCKRCGSQVWIPQGAPMFQCTTCGTVTKIRHAKVPTFYQVVHAGYPPPPNTRPMPYGAAVAPQYAPPPPPPPPPQRVTSLQYIPPSPHMPPQRRPSPPQPQYSFVSSQQPMSPQRQPSHQQPQYSFVSPQQPQGPQYSPSPPMSPQRRPCPPQPQYSSVSPQQSQGPQYSPSPPMSPQHRPCPPQPQYSSVSPQQPQGPQYSPSPPMSPQHRPCPPQPQYSSVSPQQPQGPQYSPPPPMSPQHRPCPPQPQYSSVSPQRPQGPQYSPSSVIPPPRRVPSTANIGRKKAVVCGINYYGKFRLQGSVNDAKNIRNLLIECYGFPLNSIWMLSDEDKDPMNRPTKQNMIRALEWLIEDCQSGDSLVFFYSGHGSRVADDNFDEQDGYDEALCPLDFKTAGKLLDDDINDIIVKPLPPNVKLLAIMDTCFSGTVLDLQHVCKKKSVQWEFHGNSDKETSGGLAICISACDDHQNSADTTVRCVFSKPRGGKTCTPSSDAKAFGGSKDDVGGALTHSFGEAVRNDATGLTYARLLGAIDHGVRKAHASLTPDSQFNPQSFQEPQVSSSTPFDIYNTKFSL